MIKCIYVKNNCSTPMEFYGSEILKEMTLNNIVIIDIDTYEYCLINDKNFLEEMKNRITIVICRDLKRLKRLEHIKDICMNSNDSIVSDDDKKDVDGYCAKNKMSSYFILKTLYSGYQNLDSQTFCVYYMSNVYSAIRFSRDIIKRGNVGKEDSILCFDNLMYLDRDKYDMVFVLESIASTLKRDVDQIYNEMRSLIYRNVTMFGDKYIRNSHYVSSPLMFEERMYKKNMSKIKNSERQRSMGNGFVWMVTGFSSNEDLLLPKLFFNHMDAYLYVKGLAKDMNNVIGRYNETIEEMRKERYIDMIYKRVNEKIKNYEIDGTDLGDDVFFDDLNYTKDEEGLSDMRDIKDDGMDKMRQAYNNEKNKDIKTLINDSTEKIMRVPNDNFQLMKKVSLLINVPPCEVGGDDDDEDLTFKYIDHNDDSRRTLEVSITRTIIN